MQFMFLFLSTPLNLQYLSYIGLVILLKLLIFSSCELGGAHKKPRQFALSIPIQE